MGLHKAGFDVTGVDLRPQPRYPFPFQQRDALSLDLEEIRAYDFVWASPPCQAYTRLRKLNASMGRAKAHPELIEATRDKLRAAGVPYVIENVVGAPLLDAFTLCGSQFGLLVRRHRRFEASFPVLTRQCEHHREVADKPPLHRLVGASRVVGCYGNGRGKGDDLALWSRAMGIDWMTRKELAQAIPPAYSEFIGRTFLDQACRPG